MAILDRVRSGLGFDRLRAGVVGAGSVARNAHLPVYKQDERVDLIAIADLDSSNRKSAAQDFDAERTYSNGDQMISEEDLDLVSICTPPATHESLFITAAEAGTNIYCEKPMTISVEAAKRMTAAAESAEVISQIGYTRPYVENYKTVLSLLDNSILGDIQSLHTHRIRGPPSGRWNYDPSVSGGGVVSDQLPHILDFYIRVFDTEPKIRDVRFRSDEVPTVEDYAEIDFEFDGIPVRTTLGWTLHSQYQRNVLNANRGTVEYNMRTIEGSIQGSEFAQKCGENPVIDIKGLFRSFASASDNFHSKRIQDFVDHVEANDFNTVAPVQRGLRITKIIREIYDRSEVLK
ncbi:hypothetical protein GJ633_01200 [Halorubrum sp. CBA1125]|uniref:Gfo/Idh/MocA family protein n=1 Tax=Halorubrum sp. CBA1125 TaxID=2668072 RepID=UPI0012E71C5C|nr:Gfo/Idh/MocA family oxidoreductase [Halorubrum sp. CBA1125]MUW13422.1 hypothetical protein [Halorubrum sp. CBA1125]